jgi:hypothetical protein
MYWTATSSVSHDTFPFRILPPIYPPFPSRAAGVGHRVGIWAKTHAIGVMVAVSFTPRLFTEFAQGMVAGTTEGAAGENPDAMALMWCSHIRSPEHTPFCIVPEIGQAPENNVESPSNEGCNVFHDNVAWS